MEGEDGAQTFIAHVPVPSQKEVRNCITLHQTESIALDRNRGLLFRAAQIIIIIYCEMPPNNSLILVFCILRHEQEFSSIRKSVDHFYSQH